MKDVLLTYKLDARWRELIEKKFETVKVPNSIMVRPKPHRAVWLAKTANKHRVTPLQLITALIDAAMKETK